MKIPRFRFRLLSIIITAGLMFSLAAPALAQEGDPGTPAEASLTPEPADPTEIQANPTNTETPTLEETFFPVETTPLPTFTVTPIPTDLQAATAVCPSSISFGETIQCSVTSAGDTDSYTFTASAGDKVLVKVRSSSGGLWPEISLIFPDGRHPCDTGASDIASCFIPVTGTYTILAYDGFGGTLSGDYYLSLQQLNNLGNAVSIGFGQTLSGSITAPAEMNTYNFSANAGDKVLLKMSVTSGNLLPGIKVYNPDGSELCVAEISELASCPITSTGAHTIVIYDSSDGTKTGAYYLFVQRLNNPGNATMINYGQILAGTINAPAEMDTYIFTAITGDAGLVKMSYSSGNLWPGIRVYRPDGTKLCESSGTTSAEITNCPLPSSGTYTILAFDSNSGSFTGNYSITVNSGRPPRSPANGVILPDNRPTFIWDTVDGAASYTLQVSTVPGFTTTVVNTTATSPTYAMTTSLSPPKKLMYWRTRAGSGAWSDVWTFTCANPPGVPGLSAPANASLATSYTPLLDWSASSLPKGTVFNYYRLQVAANSTFTSLVQDVNIAGLANHFFRLTTALNPNLTFFWRVAAYNTSGQYSLWSAVRSFRTPMLPPVLISPANPTIPPTLRPTFTWNKVDPAISYGFQVSTSSKFTSTVINTTVTGLSYTPTANLPANRTLFWRVHANGANPSAWAPYFTFTSPNPPSAPTLALPANAGLVSSYTPRLDWSTSSVPTGASFDHYRLQIATDKGFTTSLQDISVPGLNTNSEKILTTPLEPNRTFYWRVSAYNTAGQYSLFSAVRSFRTPMLPPVLVEPANLGQAMTTRPTFTWNAVSGATGYAIQVSTTAKFTSTLVNTTTKSLSFTPTSDLPRSKTLYWRVHADGANPSAWATNFTFTSANPPVVPVLFSPADNATFNYYTPTLDWNDPAYADRYWVQIATASTFTTASVVVNEPSITPSTFTPATPLAANTIFYWRVRVYNAGGQYSNWSAVRHFHTTLPAPGLTSPADTATGISLRPTFIWASVPGATSYIIQVSTSPAFGSTAINKTLTAYTYTHNVNLATLKAYYWRVQAKGTFNSPWSAVWHFDTQ